MSTLFDLNTKQSSKDSITQANPSPVILVTGGAKRIGAQIIKSAHANGYSVIVHYHQSQAQANELVDVLNSIRANSAAAIQASLDIINNPPALQSFAQQVINIFGRLDALVHNASRFYPSPIGQITHSTWNELFLTNAKAPLMLSQAFLPYLKDANGCIVSILDIHANAKPFNRYTVYNMAKSAHQMMVQSLAIELAPNIRVNGVAPGVNVFPEADSDQAISKPLQSKIVASVPLKKEGTPIDIAQTVIFLLTAKYITGQIIAVDGGRSLTLQGGDAG
ncbi:pteridine reductase [Psychrobacter sp. HD31]|uniref:pteridine reductase n=1 Tax=Psychrobacter sp. HD31 TaxID=3112003 RepID=UPI003DA518BF